MGVGKGLEFFFRRTLLLFVLTPDDDRDNAENGEDARYELDGFRGHSVLPDRMFKRADRPGGLSYGLS